MSNKWSTALVIGLVALGGIGRSIAKHERLTEADLRVSDECMDAARTANQSQGEIEVQVAESFRIARTLPVCQPYLAALRNVEKEVTGKQVELRICNTLIGKHGAESVSTATEFEGAPVSTFCKAFAGGVVEAGLRDASKAIFK